MKYNKLGHTDIEVSRICLGTMTWGQQNTEQEAHEQLDYALEQGVNFLDTAEMYAVPPKPETQGLTEQYIGTWLQKRQCRDKMIIATKAASRADLSKHIRGGARLTREHIHQAIDSSLQRLQTDYVDLYQLHWPDRATNFFGQLGYIHQEEETISLQESLEALADLVKAGKVRAIGVSNETPWGVMTYLKLAKQLNLPKMATIQNPYSLLNRTFEVGLAEIAHREEVELLAYSPLGFGVLSGKYLNNIRPEGSRLQLFPEYERYVSTPHAVQATQAYVDIAKRHDVDPAQMALAYVNSRPFLSSNIIGATTMAQLKANIASIDLTLDESMLEEIEAIHQQYPNPCP